MMMMFVERFLAVSADRRAVSVDPRNKSFNFES